MRVIAGSAGGLPLLAPPSLARPTMDRVREAIFSSLAEVVVGARVLDLFAGSGSLGLEALSRGAASATFVEADRRTCSVLEKNLRRCGFQAQVVSGDVFRFLAQPRVGAAWDIVLADPPYAKKAGAEDLALALCQAEDLATAVSPGGFFVLETAADWKFSVTELLGWPEIWVRTYGGSKIHLLRQPDLP